MPLPRSFESRCSKTLRVPAGRRPARQCFGVRRPSAAFPCGQPDKTHLTKRRPGSGTPSRPAGTSFRNSGTKSRLAVAPSLRAVTWSRRAVARSLGAVASSRRATGKFRGSGTASLHSGITSRSSGTKFRSSRTVSGSSRTASGSSRMTSGSSRTKSGGSRTASESSGITSGSSRIASGRLAGRPRFSEIRLEISHLRQKHPVLPCRRTAKRSAAGRIGSRRLILGRPAAAAGWERA
jgi:hypothetical protein